MTAQKLHSTFNIQLASAGLDKLDPVFKRQIMKLVPLMKEWDSNIVYGGMNCGLMGMLAKIGRTLDVDVTGVIPNRIKDSERTTDYLMDTAIWIADLAERKQLMLMNSDLSLTVPGGYGTIDENIEVLFWASLGRHQKPIILLNPTSKTDGKRELGGFWDSYLRYLRTLPEYKSVIAPILVEVTDVAQIPSALEARQLDVNAPKTDRNALITAIPKDALWPNLEAEIMNGTTDPIIVDTANIHQTYLFLNGLLFGQLGKHERPIGLVNDKGQFDDLLAWIERASLENFITAECSKLFLVRNSREELEQDIKDFVPSKVDPDKKWNGASTEAPANAPSGG